MLKEHIEAQHMHFERPTEWDACAFLGDGQLGALLTHEPDGALRIRLGHTGVYDNRPTDFTAEKESVNRKMFMTGRLPVGSFLLQCGGTVQRAPQTLSLWDACAEGTLITDRGTVHYHAILARTAHCGICRWEGNGEAVHVSYLPDPAESLRQTKMRQIQDNERLCRDYAPPKSAFQKQEADISLHIQPYFCSGGYVVAYCQRYNTLYWTIAADDTCTQTAEACALSILKETMADPESARCAHEQWWHDFYARTNLSMNDKRFERFYYAQLYKAACASRPDGQIMDTLGPWLTVTSWPAAFWNLNTQLTYSALYVPCLFDIASSLPNTLKAQTDILIQNVEPPYRADCAGIGSNTTRDLRAGVAVPGRDSGYYVELGNLPWVLHCIYIQYRMTLDKSLISDVVYPLMRRCVNYYSHFLRPDAQGVLHLLPTSSPEYGVVGPDCNYDLSLLRAGCQILQDCVRILDIHDEKEALWQDILNRLAPYPEHETEGFQINATQRMAMSHRHYSHLLMVYPLHLLDVDDPAERERILRSIAHWHSMPQSLEGYSQTGAASMYALLGDGNRALDYLTDLWNKGFIHPNTMYKEDGGPVLETPFAAMQSMLEMLLQSHGGILRFFPALPDAWTDITFDGLACEGAFRVGATLQDGKIIEIRIRSLMGEPCVVCAPFADPGAVRCVGCKSTYDGKYFHLSLGKGETATLSAEYRR